MSFDKFLFIILLFATCLMLFISFLAFRKRQLSVAKYCSLVMLAASFYSLGYAFEMISTDLESAKFWLKIEYIGVPFISTFWLILVIQFTGHQAVLNRWVMLLLFSIPALTIFLHYTNEYHHLFYRDIQLDHSNPNLQALELFKGPWYLVHITYNYLQAAVGMFLFIAMYLKSVPIVRKQIRVMMLSAAAPWLTNVIYLFSNFGMHVDVTPLGFTFSGLFYIWGIYRFNLLRLVPVAFQKVFETMQDGVIILDYENNITNVNQAAKDMFEGLIPLPDYAGSAYNVFSHDPELLTQMIVPENSERRISIKRKEETRHYDLKKSIIYDRDQTVLGKMLIFHDITQVTIYQEKLLADAKQLAELNAFKDKLFTVVAHDIRDPLAVLVNLTELLEEEVMSMESGELTVFQEVGEQVRNTYMLVENLLDWFRSQQGKIIFSPLVWELASIVQQAVHSVKIRSDIKKIQITSSVDDELRVFADKEMLELVLRNLLSNAIKFTEIGGHIHVEATTAGEQVTVSVRDSGVGVDQDIAETLFDEVQQVSAAGTEGEKGTGLGLYLSGQFIHMNGGDIWFESIHGQGSTFFFALPVSELARGTQTAVGREFELL